MMGFLSKVQSVFHEQVIRILLFVVVGIYLFNVFPYGNLGVFIRDVLVRGLVAFVVVSLALKKEWLTAHVVIFLSGFSAAGANFINALLSYNFSTSSFGWTFTLAWALNALAFVYLVLYFLTLALKKPALEYAYEDHPLWRFFALMFVFYLFRNSFNVAFFVMVPVVLVCLRSYWFFGGLLAVSSLIALPLNFIVDVVNGTLSWRPISYFVYLVLALVLLFFIGKTLWQLISGTSDDEDEEAKSSDVKEEETEAAEETIETEVPLATQDGPLEDDHKDKEEKN